MSVNLEDLAVATGPEKARNVQTIRQLHSSPMLVRSCLTSCILGLNIMWTKNFQMSKLSLEKAKEPKIKLPTFAESQRKQGNSRKVSASIMSTMQKPLANCGKLLKRWEHQTILPFSWETYMWVKKQQFEFCMEQQIGWGLRKEYNRAVCHHPVYLNYILSTSWEMLGWKSYKL